MTRAGALEAQRARGMTPRTGAGASPLAAAAAFCEVGAYRLGRLSRRLLAGDLLEADALLAEVRRALEQLEASIRAAADGKAGG